jgi:hypothetical protein
VDGTERPESARVEPVELSDAQLRTIGLIAIRAAGVEAVVGSMLRWLIDPADDNTGATLMHGQWFAWRVKKAQKLAPLRVGDPTLLAELLGFLAKAKWASEQRNEVLHSAFVPTGESRVLRVRFLPGPGDIQIEVASMEDAGLDALAAILGHVRDAGMQVHRALRADDPEWNATPDS